MNKYIMINHRDGSFANARKPESWDEYFTMLREGGHMIGGSAFDHGISVKNGAFADAQSRTIAGYIVIQAENLEAAKKIMLQSPVHQTGGTVELFTLIPS